MGAKSIQTNSTFKFLLSWLYAFFALTVGGLRGGRGCWLFVRSEVGGALLVKVK